MTKAEKNELRDVWRGIYGDKADPELTELEDRIEKRRREFASSSPVIAGPICGPVYCVYPDAFPGGLDGILAQLGRLDELGVRTLWILPLLTSPGMDQGFDISDYRTVDSRYGGNEAFSRLLSAAHARGIKILFDLAINHCSDQHPWFRDPAKKDYFIWSENGEAYLEAGHIFAGMVDSNWTWQEESSAWFFHRFYPFQPDLNYRNPRLALEMLDILMHWQAEGVDGFRLDAVALIWKEEGTNCENLPGTHRVVKLFRAVLDRIRPGTWLVAEANAPEGPLTSYFGGGAECTAVFDFPLLPRLWLALARSRVDSLLDHSRMRKAEAGDYIGFLRCHDELTLDLMDPANRLEIVSAFGKNRMNAFRNGQALVGRLFDLLGCRVDRTLMAFFSLFALTSLPVIYYGDEIGMVCDQGFFARKSKETGFGDARFLHRGSFDLARLDSAREGNGPEAAIIQGLARLGKIWKEWPDLARTSPSLRGEGACLESTRILGRLRLKITVNLSDSPESWEGRILVPYEGRLEFEGDSL